MTGKMGCIIGNKMGKVIEVKTDEEGAGIGVCLAVRVEIDITKPLMRRMKISVEEGKDQFVDFKYERLPALCYCCGVIGHNESECEIAIRKKKEGVANPAQYGKWIRAPIRLRGMKEKEGGGGRKEGPSRFREERKSDGKTIGDGSSRLRAAEIAEEAKGIMVNEDPVAAKSRNLLLDCEIQNLSSSGKSQSSLTKIPGINHGKEKGMMLIVEKGGKDEGDQTTPKATDKGAMMIDEMEWQKVEEERGSGYMRVMGSKKENLGQRVDLGPMVKPTQICIGEMGPSKELSPDVVDPNPKLIKGPGQPNMGPKLMFSQMNKADPNPKLMFSQMNKEEMGPNMEPRLIKGPGQPDPIQIGISAQKGWRRRTKEDNLMKESNDVQITAILGKRRMEDEGLMIELVEEIEKSKKRRSDGSNNASVEAGEQPHRDQ